MRVWPYKVTRVTEKTEIAPAARIVAQTAVPVTFSRIFARPASPASSVPNHSVGSAARPASATRMYTDETMINAPMIARGIAFCGFFARLATASSPMKEKKMVPAAAGSRPRRTGRSCRSGRR